MRIKENRTRPKECLCSGWYNYVRVKNPSTKVDKNVGKNQTREEKQAQHGNGDIDTSHAPLVCRIKI